MKKLLTVLLLFVSGWCVGQGTWTQKADIIGDSIYSSVGFSIGLKGYVLAGTDFLEYDQATDTWTAKANFPGTARTGAVGFAIGTKGYVGTGQDSDSSRSDFWEYDQTSDAWAQKANVAGGRRMNGVGFSIGTKGYIGTGDVADRLYFWEYDPAADTWTQKANVAGLNGSVNRKWATGFSIGQKGYISLGSESQYGPFWNDLLEYDPINDTWINKANFPTVAGWDGRDHATGFVIGNKAYVGTGYRRCGLSCDIIYKDLWEWNQSTDTWTQKANLTQTGRNGAVGLSIGDKGYIGGGSYSGVGYNDFWEYCDTCVSLIGIETIDQSVLTLYPNPATTTLTLTTEQTLNNAELKIINAIGQELSHPLSRGECASLSAGKGCVLDISSLPPGLYYLTLQSNEGVAVKKFEVIR